MEVLTGVPVSEVVRLESSQDPQIRELVEWFLSDQQGGKDMSGVTVEYDREHDVLLPPNDFRQRVEEWNSKDEPNPYPLNEWPDEITFRAFLDGGAFYYRKAGIIVRNQQAWIEILEVEKTFI